MISGEDRRRVFMRLTEKERDAALWNMMIDEISERVKLMARIIELENNISYHKGDTIPLNTEQKIQIALEKKSVTWIWYRDKVLAPTLSTLHTLIILALLYFVFGGKLPTP
jgi:hypothetical protein